MPLTLSGWRGIREARAAERIAAEIEWGIARVTRERAMARQEYTKFFYEQEPMDQFDVEAAKLERAQMVELQGEAMYELRQSLDHIMSKRWRK
jgi:hypothetical protein